MKQHIFYPRRAFCIISILLSCSCYCQFFSEGSITYPNASNILFFRVEAPTIDSVKFYFSNKEEFSTSDDKVVAINISLDLSDLSLISKQLLYTIYSFKSISGVVTCQEGEDEGYCELMVIEGELPENWEAFENANREKIETNLFQIRSFFLQKDLIDGTLKIRLEGENSNQYIFFPYSIKQAKNSIQCAIISTSHKQGSSPGLNKYMRLYGTEKHDIGAQLFYVIYNSAEPTNLYENDLDAFLNYNSDELNTLIYKVKIARGETVDLVSGIKREGGVSVHYKLPIYKENQIKCINYNAIKKYINKQGTDSDKALIKKIDFNNLNWVFKPKGINPHVGNFHLNDTNSKVILNQEFNLLLNSTTNKTFYRTCNELEETNLEVDSINVTIHDGFVNQFSFYITNHREFPTLRRFQSYGIKYSLRDLYKSKFNLFNNGYLNLWYDNQSTQFDGGKYVFQLSELLEFHHPLNISNNVYTAVDTVLFFKRQNFNSAKEHIRIREKGVLSILKLDLFGDIVGFLSEEKPNGLLQSELKFGFYGLRKPVRQKYPMKIRGIFLYKGEARLRFSKIDNSNKYLTILTDENQSAQQIKYLHAFNLYQYQRLFFDLKSDLFTFLSTGSELSFYTRLGFLVTNIRDSIVKEEANTITYTPKEHGLTSLKYSFGTNLKLFRTHDINMDIDLEGIILRPSTGLYHLSKSEFNDFEVDKNIYAKTSKSGFLLNPKFLFTYNLDEIKTRRIIMRFEFIKEINNPGNKFYIMQIGYSADLNRFINLNKPDNSNIQ